MPPELDDSTTSSTDTTVTEPVVTDPGVMANAAAKAHISRFSEKVLPGLIAAAMKPLMDEIQTLKAPKGDAEDVKGKSKNDPAMAAVTAQLEDMKAKFASAESARVAAEKRSRDDGAKAALKDALAPHVRPELLGMLTDNLYVMKGVVDFDDDGTPLFKAKRKDQYGDPEDIRLPMKDGVAQFLKSEEAKAFLPSPGSSGAAPKHKTASRVNGVTTPIDLEKADDATKIRYAREIAERARARGNT